jgi:predicted amidohydrolase
MAQRYDTAIVAGTAFVKARTGKGHGEGAQLRNRALVFGPEGSLLYRQDKVYLTRFERRHFGLSAGSLGAATGFRLEGLRFGLTICRDSFFGAWEERFADADVWMEIRANGEAYSPEVRERFRTALAERVRRSPAHRGLSTSLTGELLDLLWQGPAYTVDAHGRRVQESPKPTGKHLMVVELQQR